MKKVPLGVGVGDFVKAVELADALVPIVELLENCVPGIGVGVGVSAGIVAGVGVVAETKRSENEKINNSSAFCFLL